MSNDIVRRGDAGVLAPPTTKTAELVEVFLSGRRTSTTKAYQRDLALFAGFLGVGSIGELAQVLFGLPHGDANAMALRFRQMLQATGQASASVNRRLAAVRSLSKLARVLGIVPWVIEVPDLPSKAYRDTRGPGAEGFRHMLEALEERETPRAMRDRALIRMLYDMGLRRFEAVGIRLGHLDLPGRRAWVLGKGRDKREAVTVPEETFGALCDWLRAHPAVRAAKPGQDVGPVPLFVNLDHAHQGKPLSVRSVNRVVDAAGKAAGIKVRPHGLRQGLR